LTRYWQGLPPLTSRGLRGPGLVFDADTVNEQRRIAIEKPAQPPAIRVPKELRRPPVQLSDSLDA
jgi:hypothetical protein